MSQGNMMKFIPVEASKWGEMVQATARVKELEEALANLKAERDQLKADLEKSDGVVWTLSVENDRLKAEVEIQNQRINREDKEVAKLYRENARLKADIERLTKAGQWQPMDTAPRYQDVLCWLDNHQSIVVGWEVSSCHWEDTSSNSTINPTHWMPLPSAPSKGVQS
jgi:cell division protein FtsB